MFPFSSNMDLLIIILAVALALGGLIGGMLFWQKMAESPIWEQIRRCLKILGLGGALSLFTIVIFLVWMMETQHTEFIQKIHSPHEYFFLVSLLLYVGVRCIHPPPRT